MALVAQRPHQLVQRERASLAARRRRSGRVRTQTRHAGRRARRSISPLSSADQIAGRQRQPSLQHVQAGQRLEVVLARPAQPQRRRAARSPCRGRRRPRACGPRHRRPKPSRSSSRGCVVSGSSRQITTTRERSRISPSVAVDAPRSGTAGAPGHGAADVPGVTTSAPSRSASATAARASSTVAPSKPCTQRAAGAAQQLGGAAQRGLDVDRLAADRAPARRRPRRTRSENHSAPSAAVGLQTHARRRRPRPSRRRTAGHSPRT